MEQKKGKKQEKKKAGAQGSSSAHKAGIIRTFGRLPEKKLRHLLRHNGLECAEDWAGTSSDSAVLRKLLNSEVTKRQLASRQRRKDTFLERRDARRAERRRLKLLLAEAAERQVEAAVTQTTPVEGVVKKARKTLAKKTTVRKTTVKRTKTTSRARTPKS